MPYIKSFLRVSFLVLLSYEALAQLGAYEVKEKTNLVVKGFYGDLELIPSRQEKKILVNSNSFFKIIDTEKKLTVEFSIPLKDINKAQKVILKLVYPEKLNLDVYWYKAYVKLKGPRGKVFLQLQEGELNLEENKAEMTIYTQKAKIKILRNEASVFVKTFSSSTEIEKNKKTVSLDSFLGSVEMRDSSGFFKVQGEKTKVRLNHFSGVFKFSLREADLKAENLDAKVTGWAGLGLVNLDFNKKIDLNVKTNESSVEVAFKDLKGKVFLLSKKGSIKAPQGILVKQSLYTQAKGFFHGEKKGKILVKTEKGAIILKRK